MRYPTISHGVITWLYCPHYQSSYSNRAWLQVFRVFTATFTLISAGAVGAPSGFSPTLHSELPQNKTKKQKNKTKQKKQTKNKQTTPVKISSVE